MYAVMVGRAFCSGACCAIQRSPTCHYLYVALSICSYGNLVLAIEVISSTATLGYAILLIKHTRTSPSKGLPIPKEGDVPVDPLNPRFHVRVLIPCYTEPLETVKGTLLGALNAELPKSTVRTVYLCDDGKDMEKEKLVRELNQQYGDCVVYVAREKRRDGESLLLG